ncbi:MAG: beta-propeller fold lactonase family protein, partial [Ginsengibacter sp.]
MKKLNLPGMIMATAIIFSLASCNKNQDKVTSPGTNPSQVTDGMISENGANPDEASITQNINTSVNQDRNFGQRGSGHYLYTESNESSSNKILAYQISNNGSLHWSSSTTSGGMGSGSGLASQGAVTLSQDNDWLFAVNAGNNSVSSFKVKKDGSLVLKSTKNTWGKMPVSVTSHGNMLYVLNHGSDNIHGFWIGNDGMLTDINNSTKSLSGSGVDAPQISFTPDGNFLIVPEKATNIIGTFKIMNGTPANGTFNSSVGNTPYGFGFSRNYLVISNAEMGGAGAGSGTSYMVQG